MFNISCQRALLLYPEASTPSRPSNQRYLHTLHTLTSRDVFGSVKRQHWCFSSLLSCMWALDVVVIMVFTLMSTDAPQVLSQTPNSVRLVTIRLFSQPSKHRGSTSKGEKYVALLNYWSGHTHVTSPHTHLRCFLLSVLANRFKWKVLEHEDGRQVCETGDWLDSVSSWLRCPAKSPSAGPPQLQSAPRLRPVNTSYPQPSRSTSLQLLLAINTAWWERAV